MKPVEFRDGDVQIDASVIADGLGITLPVLRQQMRAGKITSRSERGTDADRGRYRLTFFSDHRRFRLVVDDSGAIIKARRSILEIHRFHSLHEGVDRSGALPLKCDGFRLNRHRAFALCFLNDLFENRCTLFRIMH